MFAGPFLPFFFLFFPPRVLYQRKFRDQTGSGEPFPPPPKQVKRAAPLSLALRCDRRHISFAEPVPYSLALFLNTFFFFLSSFFPAKPDDQEDLFNAVNSPTISLFFTPLGFSSSVPGPFAETFLVMMINSLFLHSSASPH